MLSPHNDLIKSVILMMWHGVNLISMKHFIKVDIEFANVVEVFWRCAGVVILLTKYELKHVCKNSQFLSNWAYVLTGAIGGVRLCVASGDAWVNHHLKQRANRYFGLQLGNWNRKDSVHEKRTRMITSPTCILFWN